MPDPSADPDAMAQSLAQSLAKLLNRKPAGSDPDEDLDTDARGKVPRYRLNEVIKERNALREELATFGEKVQGLQSSYAAKLQEMEAATQTQLTSIQEQAAAELARIGTHHQRELKLHDMGLTDPDGREALRTAYKRLPEEGRPKSEVDYFAGMLEQRAAHLKDPKAAEAPQIPKTLVAYIEEPAAAPPPARRGPPDTEANAARRGPMDVSSIPLDQGVDAFLGGLRNLAQ